MHSATDAALLTGRTRLVQLLAVRKQQYKDAPPSKHFLKGHNLCALLAERIENVLLFVRKPWVPNTNNAVERQCKQFKRAQHQAVTFRSSDGLDYVRDFLTVTSTLRLRGEDIYPKLIEIMARFSEAPDSAAA